MSVGRMQLQRHQTGSGRDTRTRRRSESSNSPQPLLPLLVMLPLSESLSKWIFDPFYHLRLDLTFCFYMREIYSTLRCTNLWMTNQVWFPAAQIYEVLEKESAQERLLDRANIYLHLTTVRAEGHLEIPSSQDM